MITKTMICGKGGDGVQFMAVVLAKIAIQRGFHTTLIKSYGPEARGGSSIAYIVMSSKPVSNPVFRAGYLLVAFGQKDVDKYQEGSDAVLFSANNQHGKSHNMFLLGSLCRKLGFGKDACLEVMGKEIEKKHEGLIVANEKAFMDGYGTP